MKTQISVEVLDSNHPRSRCVRSVLMSCLTLLPHNVTFKRIVASENILLRNFKHVFAFRLKVYLEVR